MTKHILLYTDDPEIYGVGQYNHSILSSLVKSGYRATCVQAARDNGLVRSRNKLGIQHLWLESDDFNDSFTKAEDAERILSIAKPDLIIFSDCCPLSNFAAKRVAIQLRIPYIIVEGFVASYLAERFTEYRAELSRHYTQAQAVVAVSTENLNGLRTLFGLPNDRGQVIYYGRPSQYFTSPSLSVSDTPNSTLRDRLRQELAIPSSAVVCFTAARLEVVKGYQYQLEAIKQLKQTSVWPQLYFVWAGAGSLATELEKTIEQLGVTSQVKLLGERTDIADLLEASDIFLLPSRAEGMPLAIMEAMAKGLPVIASAISGIPEELGDTGKLLPDPTIDPNATITELVTTLSAWCTNPQLRDAMGQAGRERAAAMFTEERMVKETLEVIEMALLPVGDYVSQGFSIIRPDDCFPNMIVGDTGACSWPYLRRQIPHNWYVDQREPSVGFLSRDEAHILYNTALKFKGKKALEIGCWLGWSACHLALGGVDLDVIDPLLARPEFYESVSNSLRAAGVLESVNLNPGYSPQKVEELAAQYQRKWALIFIDGDHDAPAPFNDAIACEQLAEEDALILFHDLASPDVAQGLDYLKQKGWNTMVYQTMQIMGVAWRGNIEPVKHQPDPKINWYLPAHLQHYSVSNLPETNNYSGQSQSSKISFGSHHHEEFREILAIIRPYTLLSDARLFSLYSLAKRICLNDIPGNFVECGTCKGGSAALLATVIKRYSLRPRKLYAFDTFAGMPEPTEVDRHQGIPANDTPWGVGALKAPISENLDVVCLALGVRDVVVPVEGLFSQTLPQYKSEIGNIAFLHADGDWYESTMDILNNLFDSIVQPGIIQVDDYGFWEGCKRAIHDFEIQCNLSFDLHFIDDTGVWFYPYKNLSHSGTEQVLSAKLPIHFFTIVLNGEPFIRYHIEVFKQLPFKWHWHIIEGVADFKHDTAWSLQMGGNISDKFHLNGRSVDGTTEYLDELAKLYPNNVTVYRQPEGVFWDGKREMVNAPLVNIQEECLLWQVDVDEFWLPEQISQARQMFIDYPEKTAAFYWCWYFVGQDLVISTRNCYSATPQIEWRRTWRYKPGYFWIKHEPPELAEPSLDHQWRIVSEINPFWHEETEKRGLIFQHFAYVIENQLRFKEQYYGYEDAVSIWKKLQEQTDFPILLRQYFYWVRDDALVENAEYCGVVPLAQREQNGNGLRFLSSQEWQSKTLEIGKLSPRIIVDGVFFQLYNTGIARVWTALLQEWVKSGFCKHIVVLDRDRTAPRIPGIRYRLVQPYHYNRTEQDREMLQQICDEESADLFISTYYTTPLSTPSVLMAYDMIPEAIGANLDKPMWREKHYGIRHASAYIAISENTAQDLVKFFPEIARESITVAPCGVNSNFYPATREEVEHFKSQYGILKPYFLFVGGRKGNKNAIFFFQAFAQLYTRQGFEIVCVGGDPQLEAEFRAYTSGNVVHILQLSDDELRSAYAGAVALVYPSQYEGFGLPVLEAIACGCPVITCANASIPEVAGTAALYVNNEDVDGLTNALCEVQKPNVRSSLILAGLEQAKKFSWSKMAQIVSSTLMQVSLEQIEASLLPLNLNDINWIIFPDWSDSEESLYLELGRVIKAVVTHPDKAHITLLIDTSNVGDEEANLFISSVTMDLLLEEELDISEGPEISLIGQMNNSQWEVLLRRVNARLCLEKENKLAIAQVKADILPAFNIDQLS